MRNISSSLFGSSKVEGLKILTIFKYFIFRTAFLTYSHISWDTNTILKQVPLADKKVPKKVPKNKK